jgi:hypothetical protein
VMWAPSCVRIAEMGRYRRIHHQVLWNKAVPKIVRESVRVRDRISEDA